MKMTCFASLIGILGDFIQAFVQSMQGSNMSSK